MHELRATGESLLRAAGAAKSEATREFYLKRARLLESLTKDVAWLDADAAATRGREESTTRPAEPPPAAPSS
jgi:hypothetical protein